MPKVRVRLGVGLGSEGITETARDVPEGTTVGYLIKLLEDQGLLSTTISATGNSPGGSRARLSVFVDGINIQYGEGSATGLSEGDLVHILTLLAGG